jgi:hypothetical protein
MDAELALFNGGIASATDGRGVAVVPAARRRLFLPTFGHELAEAGAKVAVNVQQ